MTDQYILDTFEENIICGTEDETPLRVIQVNLSDSNLDRCGIVRSISHPLATEAQINILYLSTYTTANIIVSSRTFLSLHVWQCFKDIIDIFVLVGVRWRFGTSKDYHDI
jgi:hypothetical protein